MLGVYTAVLLILGLFSLILFGMREGYLGFILAICFFAALFLLPHKSTTTTLNQNKDCQWIKNDYKGVVLCEDAHRQITSPYFMKNFKDTSKVKVEIQNLVSFLETKRDIMVYEAP